MFHNDLDGIVSAALYLHNMIPRDTYRLYPVSSHERSNLDSLVKCVKEEDFLVILDYEYHPRADLWIDHHPQEKFGPCRIENEKIVYDPTKPSAARIVYEMESKYKNFSSKFLEMVDRVDSAGYKTIEEIFNSTHPVMVLRAYLEKIKPHDMTYCRIVEMLVKTDFDIERTNLQMKIDNIWLTKIQQDAQSVANSLTISGCMSFLMQQYSGQFPRYAEYLNKDIKYAVRFSKIQQGTYKVNVGFNPWCGSYNDVNIGELLNRCELIVKGGGHYNVGGAVIKEENIDNFLDLLSSLFNKEEDMEKLGVDHEFDKIEAKAQELVKTGEVETIEEGRSEAVKDVE